MSDESNKDYEELKTPSLFSRALDGQFEPEISKAMMYRALESLAADTAAMASSASLITMVLAKYVSLSDEDAKVVKHHQERVSAHYQSISKTIGPLIEELTRLQDGKH